MAKVGNRQMKTLVCSECKEENYRDERNVKNTQITLYAYYLSKLLKI